MAAPVTIALDAMGGDHGPSVVLAGAAISLVRHPDTRFLLVGDRSRIEAELKLHPALAAKADILHTDVAVAMDAKPSQALRKGRRHSSMWLSLEAVRDGRADAVVSAGNTGALMRAQDWSQSPLGPPHAWPHSLRTVVALLLQSQFPMFVAWGEQLGFLYNDPYAEILGTKHPRALGRRFYDIWSEIWSDISPLVDAALAGESTYREDLPLVIKRKGYDEQAWFTFSYSPVRDESGKVAGMFCAVSETTRKIQKLGKEYVTKAVDVLDDTQKAAWKQLTGETFDISKLIVGFAPKKD